MALDALFIKSVLTLYDELLLNGVSLVYIGEFNHGVIKMFTSMSEDTMSRNSENRTIRRRVYHSMVEILQNMEKHSEMLSSSKDKGLFMLGKKDDVYYIITANRILKDQVASLSYMIDNVNSATREELKNMYKIQLKNGGLSSKGGAGLGLIDIARKTRRKLEYLFLPIDEKSNHFVLKVEIDTKQFVKAEIG